MCAHVLCVWVCLRVRVIVYIRLQSVYMYVCVCVGVFTCVCLICVTCMCVCAWVYLHVCVREIHSLGLHTHIALFDDTRETVVCTPKSLCACKVVLVWSIHIDSPGQ